MDNSKKHQKKKRSKHKQKAYKKNKYKQKNKNKNKNKKHSKKEKKITKLSQIIQPVEKQIPKCDNCHKKQSQFYCTICQVYYCAKCEEEIHKFSALKKHKKRLYKAPYNELVKKTNYNICRKHNKELSLYCIDENKLICSECYTTCKKNNHEILGLTDFSNEIYEKIKMILNKMQNEENQNKETIQKSLENQNKLKQKIKNICKKIENDSDLLIQKIQDSKINHLNLFKKIEIIINTKIEKILKDTEKKQKRILKKKIKINTIKKIKKDKNHIKLIQGGKEIIKTERKSGKNGKKKKKKKRKKQKKKKKDKETETETKKEKEKELDKKEKERKSKKKELDEKEEEFDPKMNYRNRIKLKNENKTARNPPNDFGYGKICGKKIYSSGKHEIKIKIDQFPNSKNDKNNIHLGVIENENRENFIKNFEWGGTYFFGTIWNWEKKKLESQKRKNENGKWTEKNYPKKINLKKNDIFTIFLDMDQKKISFKINEKNLEGWENLPQKVNFFAALGGQNGGEKNQITII
ncbi:tripartite motif-containing protein [Anaeramoeba flamelloides]|uniref:Tripartite motif-containing protein n=1 Tax=Anaeramoeba flamelloides TaxID=1746091 RepID=A0AAV7ZH72_9EUKA|nr:tripartite motif-containing protein [Anaeramoeba flamelloides]